MRWSVVGSRPGTSRTEPRAARNARHSPRQLSDAGPNPRTGGATLTRGPSRSSQPSARLDPNLFRRVLRDALPLWGATHRVAVGQALEVKVMVGQAVEVAVEAVEVKVRGAGVGDGQAGHGGGDGADAGRRGAALAACIRSSLRLSGTVDRWAARSPAVGHRPQSAHKARPVACTKSASKAHRLQTAAHNHSAIALASVCTQSASLTNCSPQAFCHRLQSATASKARHLIHTAAHNHSAIARSMQTRCVACTHCNPQAFCLLIIRKKVKDPVVHVSLVDYGKTKTLHTGKKQKKLGSAVLWLLAFPGESSPNFLCIT